MSGPGDITGLEGLEDFIENFDLEGGESEKEDDDWDDWDNESDTTTSRPSQEPMDDMGESFMQQKADYEKSRTSEERKFCNFSVKYQNVCKL